MKSYYKIHDGKLIFKNEKDKILTEKTVDGENIVEETLVVPDGFTECDLDTNGQPIGLPDDVQSIYNETSKLINLKSDISLLNKQRDAETKQITVELSNGAVLNGDETSQSRISRAVLGLPDDTTEIAWIDASGEAVMLTKPDLQEALTLAGTKQTEIFTKYAQLKAEL